MYRVMFARSKPLIRVALGLNQVLFPDSHDELPHDGNKYWVVQTGEGDYVGFAACRGLRKPSKEPAYSETMFLSRVGVLPEHRMHGLQKRLIRVRLAYAKRKGFLRAVSYTSNPWSARALVQEGFLPYQPSLLWAGNDVWYLERFL